MAALAGIGNRWHQRRDVHPTGRVPPHSMPQPCTAFRVAPWAGSHRSFHHRHTLRRIPWGIGRPGPRAEALRLCRLRSLAVATPESSAPTSGIATRSLRLHACSSRCRTMPPKLVVITPLPLAGGAAGTLPLSLCLRECFTLQMPCSQCCTGSPLVPHQRQRGVQHYVPHVVICPAMLTHRREQAASCHTDTRSLGPGIGAAVGITSQLAVPAAALRSASCQSTRHAT